MLNDYGQAPLRSRLTKTIKKYHTAVVVDSIRDTLDVNPKAFDERPDLDLVRGL